MKLHFAKNPTARLAMSSGNCGLRKNQVQESYARNIRTALIFAPEFTRFFCRYAWIEHLVLIIINKINYNNNYNFGDISHRTVVVTVDLLRSKNISVCNLGYLSNLSSMSSLFVQFHQFHSWLSLFIFISNIERKIIKGKTNFFLSLIHMLTKVFYNKQPLLIHFFQISICFRKII